MARRSLKQISEDASREFTLQLAASKVQAPDCSTLQRELDAEVQRLFKEYRLGKVPANADKCIEKLKCAGLSIDHVTAPYKQRCEDERVAWSMGVEAAKKRLCELAPLIILHPSGEPPERWPVVHTVDKWQYSSQTQAAHYARVSATLWSEGVVVAGTATVVRSCADGKFDVAADVDEFGAEVVKRLPGLPMRQWIKRCLQLGANPLVYNPYWDYGFWEKAYGLDNFGNDLGAKP